MTDAETWGPMASTRQGEASEGNQPCGHADLGFPTSRTGRNICLVLVPWFVVLCYGSLGKLQMVILRRKKENAPFPLSPFPQIRNHWVRDSITILNRYVLVVEV